MKPRIAATVISALATTLTVAFVFFFMLVALDGFQSRDAFGPFILFGVGSVAVVGIGAAVCYMLADFFVKRGRGALFSVVVAVVAIFALAVPVEFGLLFGGVFWAESNRKSHVKTLPELSQ